MDNNPTARELEIVQCLAEGLTAEGVGKRLFISGETVKKHVSHLFWKTGAKTRAELVAISFRQGWIK